MNNRLFTYSEFIREQIENESKPVDSSEDPNDKFSGIKKHLIELILKENEVKDVKDSLIEFLNQLEDEGTDDIKLAGLTEDSDYYELYLEYRVEIDEKLNEMKFFEEVPSDSSIFSLYDFVISGVKDAVTSLLKDIKSQLQSE